MIKPRYFAGFTGHRQLDHPAQVRESLVGTLTRLKERVDQAGGVLELYTSAAYGGDTLVCEVAGELKIPIHLILPKPVVMDPDTREVAQKSGFAADFWHDGEFLSEEWKRSWKIIQAAQAGSNGGTFRVVAGAQTEPECYYDAGLQMMECIDVLIAVWDRQAAKGLGGTEQMVSVAAKRGMPRCIISPPGGPAEEFLMERFAARDEPGRVVFDDLEVCTRDDARGTAPADTAAGLFECLESCSGRHSQYFRESRVRIILWHGVATLVASIAAVLPQTSLGWRIVVALLATFELSLVVRAYRRSRQMGHDRTHEQWMQSRFAAELMRAMSNSAGLLDPLHPLIAGPRPKWRRFAATAGLAIQRETEPVNWEVAQQHYLHQRLRSKDPRVGQIEYLTRKQAEAEPHFKRAHVWGSKLGAAAIVFVIGALAFKAYVIIARLFHDHLHVDLYYPKAIDSDEADVLSYAASLCFSLLPILLPLAAGILISLRSALDSGRRTYRYRELVERLTAAAATLETLKTENAVRRTVAATEEVLLDELIEWHLTEMQNAGR